MKNSSRRAFLKTTATVSLAAAVAPDLMGAAAGSGKIPVGLQLYAVRGEFEKDVPGTLKGVAELGYRAVEFWGYAGTDNVFKTYSANDLKELLNKHGLRCCGMHLDLRALEDAQWDNTIRNNKVLGNRFLIVAGAQQKMASLAGVRELASLLSKASEKAREENMLVGYHAHGFDFVKHEGRFAWDHLFSQARPEVVMQMDVGNTLGGGGDPIAMLKKFPGRTITIHIKEHEEKTFDSAFYSEIFKICETSGNTEWYIVEAGGESGRGFEVPRQALAALQRIGK